MKEIKLAIILNYIYIFFNFAIGFVFTPLLISILGKSDYGIYSLALALASYLSLMDLGIGNSIVRYIAKNRLDGDKKQESKLIAFFFKFFLLISIVTLIIGFTIGENLEHIISDEFTSKEVTVLKYMIFILTINFAISFIFNTFSAVLQAYEYFVFLKLLTLIRVIMTPALTYIVLLFKVDLIVMTLIILIVNTVTLITSYIYYKKKLKIQMKFEKLDVNFKKEILLYAFVIFVVVVADKLYWQTGQIILGIFKSPEEVAIYAVVIQFINIFLSLSGALNSVFLPKVTFIVNKGEGTVLSNLYLKISKYQLIVIGLFFSGFILFGKDFIYFWIGDDFKLVYILVVILMGSFFLDLIQNLGNVILQAKGKYHFRALVLVTCAILNLIIILITIEEYGMYAIVFSTTAFIFLGNVLIMNIYYHKVLNINMIKYWKVIGKYLLIIFVFNVIAKYIFSQIESNTLILLITNMAIYSIAYLGVIFMCLLNVEEKNTILDRIGLRKGRNNE